ncbi:hypothetical protein EMPS_11182 [Entomortierella parvispora]|uniref:Uncharacterized protein n=1 Tax=Entomortierella parvispora TaxID=205924 RepID=A0A9P3HLQ7_9FUNG|nr:hypothetical protein EMPS_11182 [Entomortierella parvispora]
MSGRQSGKDSSGGQSNNSGGSYKGPTNSEIYKSAGGQKNFMESYGLKGHDGGYAESRHIAEAFRKADVDAHNEAQGSNRR